MITIYPGKVKEAFEEQQTLVQCDSQKQGKVRIKRSWLNVSMPKCTFGLRSLTESDLSKLWSETRFGSLHSIRVKCMACLQPKKKQTKHPFQFYCSNQLNFSTTTPSLPLLYFTTITSTILWSPSNDLTIGPPCSQSLSASSDFHHVEQLIGHRLRITTEAVVAPGYNTTILLDCSKGKGRRPRSFREAMRRKKILATSDPPPEIVDVL